MKLYYAPRLASLAPLIAAIEVGKDMQLVEVNSKTMLLNGGAGLRSISSKNMIPVLELESGDILTETPAILMYLASCGTSAYLMPETGTLPYFRAVEWLTFFASELHKFFTLLSWSDAPDIQSAVRSHILARLQWTEDNLTGDFLLGQRYSVADIYLFVIAGAMSLIGAAPDEFPKISALQGRMASRPAVIEALRLHG